MNYAGFWNRFLALILDLIIVTFISFVIVLIYGFGVTKSGLIESAEVLKYTSMPLDIIVGWLYYACMECSQRQATVGKSMMGIIVTDLEGNRINFKTATIRHFAKIISTLILLIGYIMVAFTEKKQGLHDMMAGCLVVIKEEENPFKSQPQEDTNL